MKVFYIILLFTPILCNELVFEVINMDSMETSIVDNLPEDSSEKESSENSEEEKELEYFNNQINKKEITVNQKVIDNHNYLSNWSMYILDINCPPPEYS